MSAIANVFSKLTDQKDEYLAGHWWSSLPESLMWCRSWRNNEPEVKTHRHSSEECFAPSWSWPSVMGSVKFKYQYGKAGDIEVDFKINDCRVQVTDPITAPFASASSGRLHVRAKTLWGNVGYYPEEFKVHRGEVEHKIRISLDSLSLPFNLDWPDLPTYLRYIPDGFDQDIVEGTIMSVILVVCEMPPDVCPHTTGMVAKEVGNGLYRCVGWFNNLANIYSRAWPVIKPHPAIPEADGLRSRPLDMELVKKTREAWYNMFEVRELQHDYMMLFRGKFPFGMPTSTRIRVGNHAFIVHNRNPCHGTNEDLKYLTLNFSTSETPT
ncbi:hypothetical protein QBC32DRAFT_4821 [Pseudoneurospora amorphoporcata]|uniref:Uncharacterized protein n=1 Tax=Pseudoneurospora amorphoporcata TaxID=241081 RepID=A0AAN6NVJ4_9PEZI|nr:hypothetical protein QBC32DRAFT_4821 [Pseudoneurospora amorphoporcata]